MERALKRLTALGTFASVVHVPYSSNQARDLLWVSLIQLQDYRMSVEKRVVPRMTADVWGHPSLTLRINGAEPRSSWDAGSSSSEVLRSAWMELDEKEMK
jgi:hypothetical protein